MKYYENIIKKVTVANAKTNDIRMNDKYVLFIYKKKIPWISLNKVSSK